MVKRDQKPGKAERGPRTCCACGRVWRGYELEPYGWDVALAADERGDPAMLSTCSPECRKAKGLPERQMGLFQRGES